MSGAKILVVKDTDNVATCLADLPAGQSVEVTVGGQARSVVLADEIPFGHKFAIAPIGAGDPVLKYAEVIGLASQPIEPGQWVHVHNVESVRARGDKHAEKR